MMSNASNVYRTEAIVITRRKRRQIDRWCCFSFSNRTRFAGLRFGFGATLNMMISIRCCRNRKHVQIQRHIQTAETIFL